MITHPDVKIPRRGTIYSINEGNSINWDVATKRCVCIVSIVAGVLGVWVVLSGRQRRQASQGH